MKEKTWKYMSIVLIIISIVVLLTVFYPLNDDVLTLSNNVTLKKIGNINVTKINSEKVVFTAPEKTYTPSGVEVSQTKLTGGLIISKYHGWIQTIQLNGTRHVNKVEFGIARKGMPDDVIAFGITKKGSYWYGERWATISPEDLPEEYAAYWISVEFKSNPWIDDDIWIGVVSTADQTDSAYWMWAYSDQNPYPGGDMIKVREDWSFDGHETEYDGTFMVYTEEAAPQPPQISISIQTQVLTSLVLLFAGVISMIRYLVLIGML